MNCGQCVHFENAGNRRWGWCRADLPEWVSVRLEKPGMAWADESSPDNYANDCDLFSPRDDGDLKEAKP